MTNPIQHQSADKHHYDKEADTYDLFNKEKAAIINQAISDILKQHQVKTVLDMTCGTGLQVFWLKEQGFDIAGSDISPTMLQHAKAQANQQSLDIQFIEGDIRSTYIGKFDAVLSIFNAIGHLTKSDFELAMKNISKNLNPGGLYVFDIFNLTYFLKDDNITKLTIDWQKTKGNKTSREIQYSTINEEGILTSNDIYHEQIGNNDPVISHAHQTLQIYKFEDLKTMLCTNGFDVLSVSDIDGSSFAEKNSERMLLVAKKL